MNECSVSGCDVKAYARGWCRRHYDRWRRNGDLDLRQAPPGMLDECCIDGCDRRVRSRGWCQRHYSKWLHYGDPLAGRDKPKHDPNARCVVDGCDLRPKARGLCNRHYLKESESENDRRRYRRNHTLIKRYGISLENLREMILAQGGVCAICDDEVSEHGSHVDHDHSCCPGEVVCGGLCIRGVLCLRCNMALGLFRDSPDMLEGAASYLRRHEGG